MVVNAGQMKCRSAQWSSLVCINQCTLLGKGFQRYHAVQLRRQVKWRPMIVVQYSTIGIANNYTKTQDTFEHSNIKIVEWRGLTFKITSLRATQSHQQLLYLQPNAVVCSLPRLLNSSLRRIPQ